MKEPLTKGIKTIEINDANQIIEVMCHVSEKYFGITGRELIDALCLWEATKAEMEEDNK